MEYVIAIILILSFVACIIYILRGSNLMITMLIMATLWTVLAIIGKYACGTGFAEENANVIAMSVNDILTNVYTTGPVGWGVVLVNVMFGAFFGRVLLDTGIVSTLIRKTVELGGDKPVVTNILLCIVSAACFTTMTGPGAVISIGVIVLPILLTLGIRKNVAVWSYVASVAAGFLLNPVIFAQYVAYFANAEGGTEYTYQDNLVWAAVTCGIMMVIILVYSCVLTIRSGKASAWAAPKSVPENHQVPGIALLCPIIPILLVIILKVNVILAMIVTSVLALLLCGKGKSGGELSRSISKAFADGVVDSAAIMGFFLTVPMFCNAASLCAPYFKSSAGSCGAEEYAGNCHCTGGFGAPRHEPRSLDADGRRRCNGRNSEHHRYADIADVPLPDWYDHHHELCHGPDAVLELLGSGIHEVRNQGLLEAVHPRGVGHDRHCDDCQLGHARMKTVPPARAALSRRSTSAAG